jgi:hypothetical protein
LSTERKRISELVKPGEKVLVMFSGAAPYVCVIAKKTNRTPRMSASMTKTLAAILQATRGPYKNAK